MALAPVVYDKKVTITLRDGTSPTPVTLTSDVIMSGETIDGLMTGGQTKEPVPVIVRGKLVAVVDGNPVFPTISFSSLSKTPEGADVQNFLLKRATYATNTSTGGDGMCVYAVDIDVKLNVGCAGTPATGSIVKLRKVHGTISYAGQENGPSMWTFSGTAYGGIDGDEDTTPTPTASEAYAADPSA